MPIYRYICNNCGHSFETLFLSFSTAEAEEEKTTCPKCGSLNKKKEIGGTSFILKGGGWSKDNYRGGRKK